MNEKNAYARFLSGDTDALCEIIAEYRRGLTYYIMGFVRDDAASEEIVEDVFVRLCLKKPQDKGGASFKTWLYTIARNMAIDYLRRRQKNDTAPLDFCFNAPADCLSPESEYLKTERDIAIGQCIESLSPEYRQIIYLKFYEDFEIESIAKILKKSNHNTSALLYRAKSALKAELEKRGLENENR